MDYQYLKDKNHSIQFSGFTVFYFIQALNNSTLSESNKVIATNSYSPICITFSNNELCLIKQSKFKIPKEGCKEKSENLTTHFFYFEFYSEYEICFQVMQCYPGEENLPDLDNSGGLIDLRNEQDRFRNKIHI